MSLRKKAWLFSLAGVAALLITALFAAGLVLRTSWFKNQVRARLVSVAAMATGGRVEIGEFDYNWSNLTVEVAPFVIHGKESPQAAPFFAPREFASECGLSRCSSGRWILFR